MVGLTSTVKSRQESHSHATPAPRWVKSLAQTAANTSENLLDESVAAGEESVTLRDAITPKMSTRIQL